MPESRASYFDVSLAISATFASTSTGTTVVTICTGRGLFCGIDYIGQSGKSVLIIDSASATTGPFFFAMIGTGSISGNVYIPLMAKNGIRAILTGTGLSGTVRFIPKGA